MTVIRTFIDRRQDQLGPTVRQELCGIGFDTWDMIWACEKARREMFAAAYKKHPRNPRLAQRLGVSKSCLKRWLQMGLSPWQIEQLAKLPKKGGIEERLLEADLIPGFKKLPHGGYETDLSILGLDKLNSEEET